MCIFTTSPPVLGWLDVILKAKLSLVLQSRTDQRVRPEKQPRSIPACFIPNRSSRSLLDLLFSPLCRG
jgi:hypothetical protein